MNLLIWCSPWIHTIKRIFLWMRYTINVDRRPIKAWCIKKWFWWRLSCLQFTICLGHFSYSKVKYDRHLEMKHSGKEVEDKVEFKIATNGEKTFFCKECHYKSHASTNVKRHITTEHLGIKYPCDQCGKEFTNNSNLHQHIKRRHTKNFSWQCDQCEKQFQYEYKLKLHIGDKHLGIKHPCSKCKSAFPDIRNLRKHFQKYHSWLWFKFLCFCTYQLH